MKIQIVKAGTKKDTAFTRCTYYVEEPFVPSK
jgi:hypothetical protein